MSVDRLRSLANTFGYLVFTVGLYLAVALFWGGHNRLSAQSWVWFWQMPGGLLTWCIPPFLGSIAGIVSLIFKRYSITILACALCSGWAFTLGVVLFAAVFTEDHANLVWFPLWWFLSSSYTMLAISYTEDYL